MELRDYIRILRKRWVAIAALTVMGLIVAAAVSLLTPRSYTASTQIFVSTSQGDSVSDLTSGNTFAQARIKSYADMTTTARVLQPVITKLGLDTTVGGLSSNVAASAALNTVILSVSVTDGSAEQAAAIANAIGSVLPTVVDEIERTDATGTSPVKLSTIEPATAPTSPSAPNIKLNVALGALVGLALGLGLAVLIEALDTRIRGLRDVQQLTDAVVVGGIAFDPDAAAHPLVVHLQSRSQRAESFRTLRTNIQYITLDNRNSFVVTSAMPSEGKSTTSANLAITIAQAGTRVVIVDADLRKPQLANYLGIEGSVGLTDVLLGTVELDDALQEWGESGLQVLPSGRIPPNPSELLGGSSMRALIERLEKEYDIVIFDGTPVLPVTDAALLAQLTGGAIVIVAAGKTRRNQLAGVIEALGKLNARVLGVVITMLPTKGPDAYGYDQYSYYGGYYGSTKAVENEAKSGGATKNEETSASATKATGTPSLPPKPRTQPSQR